MTLYGNLRNKISFTNLPRITEIYFSCCFQQTNYFLEM